MRKNFQNDCQKKIKKLESCWNRSHKTKTFSNLNKKFLSHNNLDVFIKNRKTLYAKFNYNFFFFFFVNNNNLICFSFVNNNKFCCNLIFLFIFFLSCYAFVHIHSNARRTNLMITALINGCFFFVFNNYYYYYTGNVPVHILLLLL